ncbi:MAG: hypothetical protein JRJ84_00010 [Deltaproteobacteria bacterium]|nr:hypothetical protein [Deltaproteobacteria bacterium]
MDPVATTEVPGENPAVPEAPQVPWLFGCALWVPAFAAILYVVLRGFGPRPDPEFEEGGEAD